MAHEATEAAIAVLETLHGQAERKEITEPLEHYLDLVSTFSQDAMAALNEELGWGGVVTPGAGMSIYAQNSAGLLTILFVKVFGIDEWTAYHHMLGHQINWLRSQLAGV